MLASKTQQDLYPQQYYKKLKFSLLAVQTMKPSAVTEGFEYPDIIDLEFISNRYSERSIISSWRIIHIC